MSEETPTPIKTAVLPVAGLGTRFLPATKAMPKEMLTVVDRPVLQYVVDEAREAGVEHFVFVTGRNKHVIEDHFDIQPELEETLKSKGKTKELEELASMLPEAGTVSFTRQQAPKGLGHAVWCAREIIGNKPFALLLPDMVMQAPKGCLAQMMDVYNQSGGNVISVQECDPELAHKYGIVGKGEEVGKGFKVTEMVEKPEKGTAPSNLYISGRYILQPRIFEILQDQGPGAGNEIQLTDAMLTLAKEQDFFGVPFDGNTYDCGSKSGFLAANVAFALERQDIAAEFQEELRKIISRRAAG
jgi:UTP--glucose-1-phosphate uridylyltransferase